MKKLFIISGSLFLLVLIFLGVYNLAFRHNVLDPVADPKKKAEVEQKQAEENEVVTHSVAFQQIIAESILFPVVGETTIFYYSKRDQTLKEASLDGKNIIVRSSRLPGMPSRVVWAPNRLGALCLIPTGDSSLWHYVDLRNQSVTPLKKEMSRLTWTSLGDRILYQFTDPATGERSLNLANPVGTNWEKLIDLGKEDYFISALPQSSVITFWLKTDGHRESTLEVVTINGENRHAILPGRFGADFLWSPDGRRVLIQSVTERAGNTLTLGLSDASGAGYKNLFAPTLVSKIAWSKDNETFYYALPGTFPTGTVLPNDYYGKPIYTQDTFWKMNVRTGKKERLVTLDEMSQSFDATDLFLAPTESDLYFVNRSSGTLYRIIL